MPPFGGIHYVYQLLGNADKLIAGVALLLSGFFLLHVAVPEITYRTH